MNIGMLWFDNDPKKDLTTKVNEAAAYYEDKYGIKPTICFVHPKMVTNGEKKAGNVVIRTNKTVLPNHFWMGRDERKQS